MRTAVPGGGAGRHSGKISERKELLSQALKTRRLSTGKVRSKGSRGHGPNVGKA